MFFIRLFFTAMRSLESHFLRSLLATVGVLIGVGSVVACMSILEGMTGSVLDKVKTLGSNLILVQPATARVEGRVVGRAQTLDLDDIKILTQELGDSILHIAPQAIGSTLIKVFEKSETYTIIATSDAYFDMNEFEAASGRRIMQGDMDVETSLGVALGATVAEKLFGGMDPVGQTVKIRGVSYRVIGVMEKRGNIGFLDADRSIYIPIRAALKRFFNRKYLDIILVSAGKAEDSHALQKSIEKILRKSHNIRVGQQPDFEVQSLEEAMQTFNQFSMIFKVVFYSIAGISLVVGGIGIMNIMLVSVTERTREIGVRMAVGARRGDILFQFLVEALIISSLGGGLGLLLGVMLADILDKVLQGMLATQINGMVVLTALATTTLVGIFSGIYPAIKASRLDPVEALRFE